MKTSWALDNQLMFTDTWGYMRGWWVVRIHSHGTISRSIGWLGTETYLEVHDFMVVLGEDYE